MFGYLKSFTRVPFPFLVFISKHPKCGCSGHAGLDFQGAEDAIVPGCGFLGWKPWVDQFGLRS